MLFLFFKRNFKSGFLFPQVFSGLIALFLMGIQTNAIAQKLPHQKGKIPATKSTKQVSALNYQIILSEGKTYGYDIISQNKKIIHQPSKPGLPGNKGFERKTDAQKVARLVMHKISLNQMPPTISKHELDSLRVKY